jgi:hypothetical protein
VAARRARASRPLLTHDAKFTRAFEEVLSERSRRGRSQSDRRPKENVVERFVATVRRRCLVRLLIVHRRHVERVRLFVERFSHATRAGCNTPARATHIRGNTLATFISSDASVASRKPDDMGDLDAPARIYIFCTRLRALSGVSRVVVQSTRAHSAGSTSVKGGSKPGGRVIDARFRRLRWGS